MAAVIDWWSEERCARERGYQIICGIDEAGRGPLAGPVVAACVILPFGAQLDGVRDSKTLSPAQRDKAFDLIHGCTASIGVGVVSVDTIDAINILRASHQAMRDAVACLPVPADVALIDGLPVQPFPIRQIAIVKGDGRSASIAAASIIAKVTRDRIMDEYHDQYPQYGFASHKGYTTPEHVAALREHGPCAIHRRTFAPVNDGELQFTLALGFQDRCKAGHSGETVAAAHLESLGCRILARHYCVRGGELDIVAQDGEIIVFVEVKARRGGRFGGPAESVTYRKRSRITSAAMAFLREHNLDDRPCRFDIVEVILNSDGLASVNLIRDAFHPGE